MKQSFRLLIASAVPCAVLMRQSVRVALPLTWVLCALFATGQAFAQTAPPGIITTLYNFASSPTGSLVQDGSGNFYGTTANQVYRVSPAGVYTTLYLFAQSNGPAGSIPNSLIMGSDGNLYGVAATGGTGAGTVFQISPAGVFTLLHAFDGPTEGSLPDSLMQAGDGSFYGTTYEGGVNNSGTAFQLTSTGGFSLLYSFAAGVTSSQPVSLVQGRDGNFYGTGNFGGTNFGTAYGTIFRLTPAGEFKLLYSFPSQNTTNVTPNRLIQGRDGNFYGTTNGDYFFGTSTVFQITPAGVLTTLASFSPYEDGHPGLQLTQGNDGYIYGVNSGGGGRLLSRPTGIVYRIDPTAGAGAGTTTLYVFSIGMPDANQNSPNTPLLVDDNGNIYGTTTIGGVNGGGMLYQLTILPAPMTPPSITSIGLPNGEYGVAYSYKVTATQSPISFAATSLPTGLSIDNAGLISGTPTPAGSGPYTLTVSATNAFGTATATFTLTIVSAFPVITSSTTATATSGQPFSYQITSDTTPATFNASDLPASLSANPLGLISGTPTATGTYSVTLQATNQIGNTGTATLALTVNPPPVGSPVITSSASANGTQYAAFTYQITATNTPVNYSATGLPAELSLNPVTGLISGAPYAAGNFLVNLSATNPSGSGTAQLTLTIVAPLPIVELMATVPSVTADSGDPGEIVVSRTGDLSGQLTVFYSIRGTAQNGVDYDLLSGKKRIKIGESSATIRIIPINRGSQSELNAKLILLPDVSYQIGAMVKAKVKIEAGQ